MNERSKSCSTSYGALRTGWGRFSKNSGRVTAVPTHHLSGTFSLPAVNTMATDDARAGFYTDAWGDDNNIPHSIHAINSGAEVSGEVVAYNLHADNEKIENDLETTVVQIPPALHKLESSASKVKEDETRTGDVEKSCKADGLPLPDHRVRRVVLEILAFAVLLYGDAKFNALSFQVFGLSDKSISRWFPISEDQAVAVSVIAGLFIGVAIAGARLARFWHTLGYARTSNAADDRRRKVRVATEAFFALLGIAFGVLCILFGVSGIRADFLSLQGIPAHWGKFLLIQLGVATAGLLLACLIRTTKTGASRRTSCARARSSSRRRTAISPPWSVRTTP
jgi:hypothetical protein